ncbi:MAG: hypothetical protein AAGF11_05925 [Myxococcota bacterium]
METLESPFYFAEVAAAEPGVAFLTAHFYVLDQTDEKVTRALKYDNGEWYIIDDLPGIAHCLRFETHPQRAVWILDRYGTAWRFDDSGLADEDLPIAFNGFVHSMRRLGGRLLACGGQHSVFVRTDKGWQHYDQGIFQDSPEGLVERSFCDIDGSAFDDVYCVGWNGAIAHFDGRRWALLEPPTDTVLYRVMCRSRDEVYLCGANGNLFRGNRRAGWQYLGLEQSEELLYSMAWFAGALYVCSSGGLWRLDQDQLMPVEPEIDAECPRTYYKMSASEQELWITTMTPTVYRFDSKNWEVISFPSSQGERDVDDD